MKLTLVGAMAVAGFVIALVVLAYVLKRKQRRPGGQETPAPRLPSF